MSVEDIDKIDRFAFDRRTGDVHLVISDHLDWDENEGEHLLLLQDKLNTYLEFVESGQLYAEYPRAAGKRVIFYVMAKFPLSDEASKFYQLAGKAIQDCGCSLQFVHHKPEERSTPTDGRGRNDDTARDAEPQDS
jgi:hypothetical protein